MDISNISSYRLNQILQGRVKATLDEYDAITINGKQQMLNDAENGPISKYVDYKTALERYGKKNITGDDSYLGFMLRVKVEELIYYYDFDPEDKTFELEWMSRYIGDLRYVTYFPKNDEIKYTCKTRDS